MSPRRITMRKASPPSKPEQEDLLPEYRFDYPHAKSNRFASKEAKKDCPGSETQNA